MRSQTLDGKAISRCAQRHRHIDPCCFMTFRRYIGSLTLFCILALGLASPGWGDLGVMADRTPGDALQHEQPIVDISSWWVSPGETASLNVIRRHVEAQGLRWQQRLTPGSGSNRYSEALKYWVAKGTPPVAAHIIGFDIQDFAQQGKLAYLDAAAKTGEWDEVVPFGIQRLSKYQGHWVAVPINVHSTNWLYLNMPLVAQLGLAAPDTWDELPPLLAKAKAANIIPLAIGKDAWEHTLLFEAVAAATGGSEFYHRAFLNLEPEALAGPEIETIFHRMEQLHSFVDADFQNRSWDEATDLVREGKALLQVQGSWVVGEFASHGLEPDRNYLCWRFPDTQGIVLFNADQYIFFKDAAIDSASRDTFARVLMQPDLQIELNIATGAAPARVDVRRAPFNSCGKQSITDLRRSNLHRTLMGSIAMGNANPPAVKTAIYQIVSDHFTGQIGTQEAVYRLRQAIQQATKVRQAARP